MLPGERALVRASPRHAYDGLPRGRWVRPAALPAAFKGDTEWEVLLVTFEKPLNWHAASPAECLEAATTAKASGVALYKSGCWALARTRFEALASRLNGLRGLEEAEEAAANALRASCLLNAAAAAFDFALDANSHAEQYAIANEGHIEPDEIEPCRAVVKNGFEAWEAAGADHAGRGDLAAGAGGVFGFDVGDGGFGFEFFVAHREVSDEPSEVGDSQSAQALRLACGDAGDVLYRGLERNGVGHEQGQDTRP
jgi:hypothetical protein